MFVVISFVCYGRVFVELIDDKAKVDELFIEGMCGCTLAFQVIYFGHCWNSPSIARYLSLIKKKKILHIYPETEYICRAACLKKNLLNYMYIKKHHFDR